MGLLKIFELNFVWTSHIFPMSHKISQMLFWPSMLLSLRFTNKPIKTNISDHYFLPKDLLPIILTIRKPKYSHSVTTEPEGSVWNPCHVVGSTNNPFTYRGPHNPTQLGFPCGISSLRSAGDLLQSTLFNNLLGGFMCNPIASPFREVPCSPL